MDISHADRSESARAAFATSKVTERGQKLIANVLRAQPVDNVSQWLALGGVCPYWPNQIRERAAWIDEIRRQRQSQADVEEIIGRMEC